MFGNLLLGLTVLTYLALSSMILGNSNSSGGNGIGWLVGDALLVIYALLSLIITIKIAANGDFVWLANAMPLRNIAIGMLWLGMVAGVAICTYMRSDWHADNITGLFRLLSLSVYYGAAWLPLLMLVPYAILLNPEWQNMLSPNLYKIPLVLGCLLGWFLVVIPKTVITKGTFTAAQTHIHDAMGMIKDNTPVMELLQLSHDEVEQVRNAALAKIKTHKDLEDELIKIFEQNNPYANYWVYMFLDDNKIEHPERFIEPINNSIPFLSAKIQEVIDTEFSRYSLHLELLKVEALCHLLGTQFKDHRAVFQPNMLKLQTVLEMPPVGSPDETQSVVETLNKYRLDVKNWLDAH